MNRQDRAKQFMPFDALKGLREELKLREEKRLVIERKTLTEDRVEEISLTLARIKKQTKVQIVFYYNGHYVDLEGDVIDINKAYKYITIGRTKIPFEDIYEIKIIAN